MTVSEALRALKELSPSPNAVIRMGTDAARFDNIVAFSLDDDANVLVVYTEKPLRLQA